MPQTTRRNFLKTSAAAAAAVGFPTIVPSSVLGQMAPSKRINIGAIGVGRISRIHDMPGVWQYDDAKIIAVCDLYAPRVEQAKQLVNGVYAKKMNQSSYDGVTGYHDYHDLLANKDIDAVIISTPDHQHARLAAAAVRAGKDVYMQKPTSLTITEGRYISNAVQASGRILQIGSQQRSTTQFRRAAELVRNGRIGDIQHVEVGLPGDPAGGNPEKMPVPDGFDYDAWLGSTPDVYYTLDRVMPTTGFDRPGWLRMEQFGAGMITGWGAHHIDSAHWGMNTEYTGPVEVWGEAEFPHYTKEHPGLWNVHGKFLTHARYANGTTMDISGDFPNGIKFTGTKGWLFVTRTENVTASDPTTGKVANPRLVKTGLDASDPSILDSEIGKDEINLYYSREQHRNWLDCIKTRQTPISPIELGHRACSTCLVHQIAMHSEGRHLHWDPQAERFVNDEKANSMLSRPQRPKYALI